MNPKSPSKVDRKTIEKNRRIQMKQLYSQLHSIVSHQPSSSKESRSLPDQIEEATSYIKKLQEEIEKSKQKKNSLLGVDKSNVNSSNNMANSRKRLLLNSPVQIEVNENGGSLEVTLVTSLECQFVFTEAIRILHEEHAEVFDASYSVVQGSVFHTIHAKIGEAATNCAVPRIMERLNKFAL